MKYSINNNKSKNRICIKQRKNPIRKWNAFNKKIKQTVKYQLGKQTECQFVRNYKRENIP